MVRVVDGSVRPDGATIAAFLGVAVLGGLNTIAVKVAVAELEPLWGSAGRFLVAGTLLALLVALTRRPMPRGRSLLGAALYGAVAFTGSYALLSTALLSATAGTVAVFLALVPLETFGLATLLGQEPFRARGLVGAAIALVGVAVVMGDQLGGDTPLATFGLILAGTLFIAAGGVLLKWIPRADPYATNGVAMLSGATLLLALSALAGDPWVVPTSAGTWLAMTYVTVLGSIGLFGLYLFAVRRWTASAVSYATLLMPLVAVPLAAILVDEQVSLTFIVGAGVAVAGTYVGAFSRTRAKPSTATSAPECLPIEECPPAPAAAGARPALDPAS